MSFWGRTCGSSATQPRRTVEIAVSRKPRPGARTNAPSAGSVACCLTSLGLALALYGYSYVISVKPAAELTAKALVDALEKAAIKTTVSGTMSLAPNSELRLASGQTVKLAEGATVKLDPNSSVRVAGDIKMPQPSDHQLQPNTMSGDRLPFTSYTIFRSVAYGPGRVETGWNFALSDTTRPRSQYCSYIQTISKGAQVKDLILLLSTDIRVGHLRWSKHRSTSMGPCQTASGSPAYK